MKDLVIRATTNIQEENLSEFEKEAREVLADLNSKKLETDEDFVVAKKDVEDCKVIEQRIDTALQELMLGGQEEVAKLIDTATRIKEDFRKFRLDREKRIAKEEANKKKAILDEHKKLFLEFLNGSPVAKLYRYDLKSFDVAAKGKRNLNTFRKACEAELKRFKVDISQVADRYDTNVAAIETSEQEYPGLFADKVQLVLKPVEEVEAIIDSRVNSFRLKTMEKEQAKKEQPAPETQHKPAPVRNTPRQPAAIPDFQPPDINLPPSPSQKTIHPDPEETEHTIMVKFSGSIDSARSFAKYISEYDGVVDAAVVEPAPQLND